MRLSVAAAVWQVPYLLPKFGFPLLRLSGWVDLTDEELEMKAAPFKIAARKLWASLKTSTTLDEHQRSAIEQKRSLQTLKWDDRFLFMAQDLTYSMEGMGRERRIEPDGFPSEFLLQDPSSERSHKKHCVPG